MANEKYVMMSDNPTGTGSFSLNREADTTIGNYSHAEGRSTTASGFCSHSEGDFTIASGGGSHAEGFSTKASGEGSHAEGIDTAASGIYSHAEGFGSSSSGGSSHSEGNCTAATGDYSHAEGGGISDPLVEMTITSVDGKVITCADTTFSSWSTIKKYISVAGVNSNRSIITDYNSSEKTITIQKELDFQVGDILTISTYGSSIASGNYSHAEGYRTIASGEGSHAEGQYSTASHEGAHAEGNSRASGRYSHAEGGNGSLASGSLSHAEGSGSTASGSNSHAEGLNTIAYGSDSHAEGLNTYAYGDRSHAEGGNYITDLGTATISAISRNVLTISDFTNWSNISNNYSKVVKDHYSMIITSYSSSNNTITLLKSVSRFKVGDTVKICKYGVNFALGNSSHSEGQDTQARGTASHSEGRYTTASGDYSHAEGGSTTASGSNSHAEGLNTIASGSASHAEGSNTTASGSASHAEGRGTASGDYSHAEGGSTTASGDYSHAEGAATKASGDYSHAEGGSTTASGYYSHAQGYYTTASGKYSHAEGEFTEALGMNSHAEGYKSVAQGKYSHAQGGSNDSSSIGSMTVTAVNNKVLTFENTTFTNWSQIIKNRSIISLDKNGMKMVISEFNSEAKTLTLLSTIPIEVGDVVNIYTQGPTMALGDYSTAEGYNTTASRDYSHAQGYNTIASGDFSTAEGYNTTASGSCSHAEGGLTIASGMYSHAQGYKTKASGYNSHAEGYNTTASRDYSTAEGYNTTASVGCSHAEGYNTTSSNYASHASGKYNVEMTTGGAVNNTIGTAFVIGNGTDSSALSNAFSVQFDGTVKAKSTITASITADYAEFFEWLDKNTDEEDRVGHFVTIDGDKIKIATSEDDYILGIVSGEPFVLGNGDCDTWNGMFLHDEFRRTMYEPAPKMIEVEDKEIIKEEYIDEETREVKTKEVEIVVGHHYEEVEGEYEGTRPVLNPEYDPTQKYISRFDRAEWSPVGMLGVLAVLHDGTAEVNGYVTVNNEGIATKCTRDTRNSYRVIKKVSDKVVEVIFR